MADLAEAADLLLLDLTDTGDDAATVGVTDLSDNREGAEAWLLDLSETGDDAATDGLWDVSETGDSANVGLWDRSESGDDAAVWLGDACESGEDVPLSVPSLATVPLLAVLLRVDIIKFTCTNPGFLSLLWTVTIINFQLSNLNCNVLSNCGDPKSV